MRNYLQSITKTKFAHGLFMAVGGAIMTALYTSVQSGHIPQSWTDFKPIVIGGVGAAILYIGKNMGLGNGVPEKSTNQNN